MDFNGDGHTDLLTATFDGSPHISYGSEEGFSEPVRLKDGAGERILISSYWDYEAEEHKDTNRALTAVEGQGLRCISALAYDWDADGDYDLLLGTYREGRLFRQMNEGSNEAPKFTGRNLPVEAGGEPVAFAGKLTTPRLVDWDGDGDLDLVLGTFDSKGDQGGAIHLALDEGRAGEPRFGALQALVVEHGESGSEPLRPNEGLYADPVDFDGDGDLDLLVGAYSRWKPIVRELSPEELVRVEELRALRIQQLEQLGEAEDDEARKEAMKRYQETNRTIGELVPSTKRDGFVWLYERLDAGEAEKTSRARELAPTAEEPLVADLQIAPEGRGRYRLTVRVAILEGWHAYGFLPESSPYVPLTISLDLPEGVTREGKWSRPESHPHPDDSSLTLYEGTLEYTCQLEATDPVAPSAIMDVVCRLRFQVCDEDKCLPPKTLELRIPNQVHRRTP